MATHFDISRIPKLSGADHSHKDCHKRLTNISHYRACDHTFPRSNPDIKKTSARQAPCAQGPRTRAVIQATVYRYRVFKHYPPDLLDFSNQDFVNQPVGIEGTKLPPTSRRLSRQPPANIKPPPLSGNEQSLQLSQQLAASVHNADKCL